jgi:hypothetical protein
MAWRQTVSVWGWTRPDRAEDGHGAVEDAEGAFDFGGEVHVSGSVDQVDPVLVPEASGGGGGDGDAALLLLNHPVHRGGALMDFPDLVVLAGVIEDALGERGLASVDVGHDADVAGHGEAAIPALSFRIVCSVFHLSLS